jgi:hypothetical protein
MNRCAEKPIIKIFKRKEDFMKLIIMKFNKINLKTITKESLNRFQNNMKIKFLSISKIFKKGQVKI